MLTLWDSKQSALCDGVSRRSFLKIGAFGAGLTLADMLRVKALGASGPPTRSAKSAILIFLEGGPAHQDTYDLKPDAPAEFRGEFKPIRTNVPGVQICEHLPLQARMWDKLAVIRSVISLGDHSDSIVSTGRSFPATDVAHHPCFGSVVSKLRGDTAGGIPPFVNLRKKLPPSMSYGTNPGYLGVAHLPFSPDGPGLRNLRLPDDMTVDRLEDRRALLGSFDTLRRDIDATGTMKGMDSFTSRAFDTIASGAVQKALDLSREPLKTRDRYKGLEKFLLARRLVEAGVGCVTLEHAFWDHHFQNFKYLRKVAGAAPYGPESGNLPDLDRGIANLIQDLHDRGLENDVVTLCCGEMGRTPRINKDAGRDHWGSAMSVLVAGGGLKMGQAIGSTTAHAEVPKDRPYPMAQVLSTIYRAIGIDPALTFPNGSGRPMFILDDREPVRELL